VVFKKLFGKEGQKKKPQQDEASTIEDLIVLERYDEAVAKLKPHLKQNPQDLHAHLRLAEAYLGQGERGRALDEFMFVADEYARDGFYDRGIALLRKAKRFAPATQAVDERIERLELIKGAERSRARAVEALRSGRGAATAAIALEGAWPEVAGSDLMRNLGADPLKRLFAELELVVFTKEEKLGRAGQTGDRLYFLLSGTVSARLPGATGARAEIRTFGPGDVIGESVLLEQKGWPAEYVVAEAGRALVLDREGLAATLQGNPDPRGFLTSLRMQHSDRHVAKMLAEIRGTGPAAAGGEAAAKGPTDPQESR